MLKKLHLQKFQIMLKIGVLGAGHLGKIHIKCIKNISNYELIGFYDPDDENSAYVEKEFGIKRFSTISSLIEEVDVVDIVTPTISHYECAAEALKKTRHVFIEKPVVNTLDEARSLISLSDEANIKVQVGHVERYNPAFIAAQPYFEHPMFIETHPNCKDALCDAASMWPLDKLEYLLVHIKKMDELRHILEKNYPM